MRLRDITPTLVRTKLSGRPPCMLELIMPDSVGSSRFFYDPADLASKINRWLDTSAVFFGNKYLHMGLSPLCTNGLIKVDLIILFLSA